MKSAIAAVPDGYMRNASGHLVPIEQVREQDKLRDQVARELSTRALALAVALKEFKQAALADIADLVTISGERYGVELGGKKGNVTVTTYDGRFRIQRAHADLISFTEELEAAKALINNCIERWSEGANPHIRVLVDRAFRTDTKGQIKTAAVLELLRLEIEDEEWQRAMEAIKDSIQSTGTAVYIRVYQRVGETDRYDPIVLDLAGA